jgi:hypothetical protein
VFSQEAATLALPPEAFISRRRPSTATGAADKEADTDSATATSTSTDEDEEVPEVVARG